MLAQTTDPIHKTIWSTLTVLAACPRAQDGGELPEPNRKNPTLTRVSTATTATIAKVSKLPSYCPPPPSKKKKHSWCIDPTSRAAEEEKIYSKDSNPAAAVCITDRKSCCCAWSTQLFGRVKFAAQASPRPCLASPILRDQISLTQLQLPDLHEEPSQALSHKWSNTSQITHSLAGPA